MTQPSAVALTPGVVCLDSIKTTLLASIGSGRVGDPVNVRLHWQTGNSAADLADAAVVAVSLADSILSLADPVWHVRVGAAGRMLHVLASDDRGRTALITLCTAEQSTLALTIYGNHGVVRLDDTRVGGLSSVETTDAAWTDSLQQAIRTASV